MAGVPPVSGEAYTFYFSVTSQADTDVFQNNPTIAAGDFQYSNDGGANWGNPGTIPAVTAGNTRVIKAALTGAEMTPSTGDKILFWGHDQAGNEWQDYGREITVTARDVDDLAFPNTSGRGMDVDASGGVEVGSFQTGAITAAAIAADAITATAIAANTIGSSEIAADAITSSELATSAANEIATAVGQRSIPDSYAADGSQPTIEQALLMIVQFLHERAVSGTTVTVRKPDGSTSAMTFTMDSGTDPTSITRSS